MTRRERIQKSLSYQELERPPMDLGSMLSTSVSCFAYPGLVSALNLPPRRPRVYDTYQMLAFPDPDVLDALDCDVVPVFMNGGLTNALPQPAKWRNYDFGGRLAGDVLDPTLFRALQDGTVLQRHSSSDNSFPLTMPPHAHVFEAEHGGQAFDLSADPPKPDLKAWEKKLQANLVTPEQVEETASICRRVRETTDRAVFLNGPGANICLSAHGGVAAFPLLCMLEPEFVEDLHEISVAFAIENVRRLLPKVGPHIDIFFSSSDDWGSQSNLFAPPHVYERLFLPYYRRFNVAVHKLAPNVKTFMHSCGAVYDILDLIVESGFDILNPIQWSAGGRSYREWKDKCRNRIVMWGGGVNSQATLPRGSVKEVEEEVKEVVCSLNEDGGFVFSGIHNILAEIPGDKIIAMYKAASTAMTERVSH